MYDAHISFEIIEITSWMVCFHSPVSINDLLIIPNISWKYSTCFSVSLEKLKRVLFFVFNMITPMRPSLLLLLFGAIPFLSIHWDHEKGGGALGGTKEEKRGLNRGRRYMSVGEEDQESPGKMSKKENVLEAKGTKGDRKVEGSLAEVLAKTKIKVKEKARPWKIESEDLRLSWVTLMKGMLKDLEMKAPGEDPKQDMADLEDHLEEVKERATVWQGLAKERIMTIMDRTNEPRAGPGEEKRKIGKRQKKNKGYEIRRGLQKITGAANNTNKDSKKKNQTCNFPLQSFTTAPSASKFQTIVRCKFQI